MTESDRAYLLALARVLLARVLDGARRVGGQDVPEGARYIQISHTLAEQIAARLREIGGEDVKAVVVLRMEPATECFEAAQFWVVECCPYCGGRHVHGAGAFGGDPRQRLGYRVAHCGPWGYELVEEEP